MRLHAIGVQDATGEAERQQLLAFDCFHRLLNVTLAADLPAWQEAVQAAQASDVLLSAQPCRVAAGGGTPWQYRPCASGAVDGAARTPP